VRHIAIAIAAIAYLSAILFFRPQPTPGPVMRDFEAYYAAGATWNRGEDPYGRTIWLAERSVPGVSAARDETLPFVNPPIVALPFFGLLARLPFAAAAAIWACAIALALVLLIVATLAIVGGPRDWRAYAAAAVFALAFGPISSNLALGQAALIAAAAVVCTGWSLLRDRPAPAAIGAYIALVQPALALPLVAWLRTWRWAAPLALAGAAALVVWVGMSARGHVPGFIAYATLLREHGSAERFALIQYTPAAIAYGLGANDAIANAIGVAIALVAVLCWLVIVARSRAGSLVPFVAACALLPFVVPFFHEHDFALLWFPCAFVLVRSGRDLQRSGLALLATLLIAVDWLGVAQRSDGAAQTLLLLIAVAAAAVALAPSTDARSSLVTVAPAAMLFVAAALAQHHAAPIWPDAMRPFSMQPDASIAAVWHAEQAAAGMFARVPFWALLRVPPLIGCALTGWLVSLDLRVSARLQP
jgi:hypothetical protein